MVDEALSAALVTEPMPLAMSGMADISTESGQQFQIQVKIRLTLSRISFKFVIFFKKWLKSVVFCKFR